ncbi:MAG: hypothetical protein ITG00_04050 [Flavobacterium sp.]|nr:hypothetical protein [Flavobacterium sp.]
MRFPKFFLMLIAAVSVSCNSDDSGTAVVSGDYANGFLVLNEGGTGEVTYMSSDLATVEHDIFSGVNGSGQDLGAFAQSMFFDGDRAFVISNGSNKITVVNRYTFEYIASIDSGFQSPRYGVVSNGKAFVTNSNDFMSTTDDFISVVNLSTLSVEGTITANDQTEKITAHNGKIYVATGYFGVGDKIIVIDAASEEIITKITVPAAPNSLEVHNQTLFVLSGSFDGESSLSRIDINNNSVISSTSFPSTMGNAVNLDIEDDFIYFTSSSKIYKFSVDVTAISDTPLVDTQSPSFYMGYGFAVNANRIYISEAADDFASDGSVFIYGTDGSFIAEKSSGLGPNGFYFN